MRLFDIKVSEQDGLVDSGQEDFIEPVFDNTDFGGFKVWFDIHQTLCYINSLNITHGDIEWVCNNTFGK